MKKIDLLYPILTLGICSLFIANVHSQTVRAGLDFDGVDDQAIIPHNSAYDLGTGPFTFEAWIQADANSGFRPIIFSKKDSAINATGFQFGLNDNGRLAVQLAGNLYTSGGGMSAIDVTDNNCHHVVYVRDKSGASDTLRAYIDGVLQNRSVDAIPDYDISSTFDMVVGWSNTIFFPTDNLFDGMIKEVRIWNITRSQADIQSTMDKFLEGNEAGLVGYWRLNENSGESLEDLSSAGNDGLLGLGSGADARDPVWAEFCDVINDVLPPPNPTGIEEINEAGRLAYPNPVTNALFFNLAQGEKIQSIAIYDITGKRQTEAPVVSGNRMDVSALQPGFYLYQLQLVDGTVVTERFSKL